MSQMKSFVDHDPWLQPYITSLHTRQVAIATNRRRILGHESIDHFSLGHLYFGLHREGNEWIFREWAPNATKIILVGEFNDWQEIPLYQLTRLKRGIWELRLPHTALRHGQHYKLRVYWRGGQGDRLPSYATYVVQDPVQYTFDAVVWSPHTPFSWTARATSTNNTPPLVYEAHIGMSSDAPVVATYRYFATTILPRIKASGYNTVQLMGIAEHPYYGSYGYHVTNFFAVSSRFGTPDDFKYVVDSAHRLGLRVILDLVHSHAAKNEIEGLSRFDGTQQQYFHKDARGEHVAWDSRLFDYGKSEVAHFLLSNCRFWLDEYQIDGFRFDGITSMLYSDHGLGRSFCHYDDYFDATVDIDALTYLSMANELIHTIRPQAITIAEDMSGMPGLCAPPQQGGIGFDYRLSMGTPDMWIRTVKEQRDEEWDLTHIFHELTTKRPEEQTICYVESHDQALVGDKTLLFRLLDATMYTHMTVGDTDITVDRGIALIKLIRLLTATTHGGGYLNFMGNEFGHPEWIDFPREGNNWSYAYARRQWSLADNPLLKYHQLALFDRAMIDIVQQLAAPCSYVMINQQDHIISFMRDTFLCLFNFSPTTSVTDYTVPTPKGTYVFVLSTDESRFGGHDHIDKNVRYTAQLTGDHTHIRVYLPARCALILQQQTS